MTDSRIATTVVLLSTGRTGTTAIAEYFEANCPQVKALHEPKPSRSLRLASNRYVCGKISKDEMTRKLYQGRRRLLQSIAEPIYIESNPFLHGFLEVLDQVFPNVKTVHIVRDPRTYIRSSMNFRSGNIPKWLLMRLWPYWIVKPEQHVEPPTKSHTEMSEIEWLAWNWNMRNTFLNRGETLYGENYVRMRFEDIFDLSGSGMRRLVEWIGLPDQPLVVEAMRRSKINASTRERHAAWDQWTEQERQHVVDHCGELAKSYGYDLTAPMHDE